MSRLMSLWTSGFSLLSDPGRWQTYFTKRRLTWLVILAVFGLSAILGILSRAQIDLIILALIFGVAGMVFLLRWPEAGIIILIAGTFLIRSGLSIGGYELSITLILPPALLFFWLLDMLVRKKQVQFVASRPLMPLVALCIVSVLSFGIGQLPWFYYAQTAPIFSQIAALALFLLSAGAVFITAHQIKDIKWLKWMTWIFLACGAFNILGGSYMSSVIQFHSLFPLATGSVVWIWMVALSLSQALFNTGMQTGRRLLLLMVAAGTFFVAFTSWHSWNSGWIPSLIVIAVILLLRFPRLLPLFFLAGVIAIWSYLPNLIVSDQYSYDTRLEAWKIVMRNIVPVNPLFGLGPANYRFYTQLFPIMGWAVQFNSHNNYVDIIAQIGIIGLACFLWFFYAIWRLGMKLRKLVPQHGFAHAYIIGALAGLVGTLVTGMLGDWVVPFIYNVGLNGFRSSVMGWLFLGGLIAIEQIYQRQDSESSPQLLLIDTLAPNPLLPTMTKEP